MLDGTENQADKAYSKMEAVGLFLEAATATTKPFIYTVFSGISNAEFTRGSRTGCRVRSEV